VPRFSQYFREAFPGVFNITPGVSGAVSWREDDVCVTDNHLSIHVPSRVQTIVVHHGCAPYHYEVDESWRSPGTEQIATAQRLMFHKPNRIFVAPSLWIANIFKRYAPASYVPLVLPHWVPLIKSKERTLEGRLPVVVGDWRNANKGKDLIDSIRRSAPEIEFRQLDFDGADAREKFYRNADAYLCLSLSEGAPYSVADAEAASLPIVTTEVGNVYEFEDCWRIENRESVENVVGMVRGALEDWNKRGPSYFEKHNFEAWKAAWQVVIDEAEKRSK
jgi:hypothetical protein